jgi:hypothetical protein
MDHGEYGTLLATQRQLQQALLAHAAAEGRLAQVRADAEAAERASAATIKDLKEQLADLKAAAVAAKQAVKYVKRDTK